EGGFSRSEPHHARCRDRVGAAIALEPTGETCASQRECANALLDCRRRQGPPGLGVTTAAVLPHVSAASRRRLEASGYLRLPLEPNTRRVGKNRATRIDPHVDVCSRGANSRSRDWRWPPPPG